MSKFFRSTLGILVAIIIVVAGMSGCGKGSDAPSSSNPSDPKSVSGKVDFRYWGAEQKEIVDTITANFMKEYSNITVTATLEPSDQYWTKMITSIAAKKPAADVMWLNPTYAVQMMNANQLVPVQDLYDSGAIDTTKFTKAALGSYTNKDDGKLYGVPKDFQTVCLIYNKGIFDEVGLEYPGNDYTWDQLVSDAQKIVKTDSSGKTIRYGYVHNYSVMSSWFVYSYANGGKLFDPEANNGKYIDTPENREAFQWAADLIFKYKVAPDGQTTTETNADELFINEKVAMTTYVPAQIENYTKVLGDKVGIAGFPYNKQKATITNCLAYGITAGTPNLEAAKIFLTYLGSKEGQEPQAKALIPAYAGIESDMQKKFSSMNFQVYLDAGQYAVPTPVEKYIGNTARQKVEAEVSNIIFGEKDVLTAIADAEKAIVEAVEKAIADKN